MGVPNPINESYGRYRRFIAVIESCPSLASCSSQNCGVESAAGLYWRAMEVRFTPEIEAQLNKLATRAGKDAEFIVQDLIRRLIYHDEAIVALMKDSATE